MAKPKLNEPVLTIAKIITTVMASAAEAEMAALYITAKTIIPLRNTLIEMGWPQPQTPIQTDNSTAVGFTKKNHSQQIHQISGYETLVAQRQGITRKIRYYWAPGSENEGDYSTKHHPPIYHEAKRANPYLV